MTLEQASAPIEVFQFAVGSEYPSESKSEHPNRSIVESPATSIQASELGVPGLSP